MPNITITKREKLTGFVVPTQPGAKTYWEVEKGLKVSVVNTGVYLQLCSTLLKKGDPVGWTRELLREVVQRNDLICGTLARDPINGELVLMANVKRNGRRADLDKKLASFATGLKFLSAKARRFCEPKPAGPAAVAARDLGNLDGKVRD